MSPPSRSCVIPPVQCKPKTRSEVASPAARKRRLSSCANGAVSSEAERGVDGSILRSTESGSAGTRTEQTPNRRPMEAINPLITGCKWKCLWALQ